MDYKDVKPNVNVDERRDCPTGVLLREGGDCRRRAFAYLHLAMTSPEV